MARRAAPRLPRRQLRLLAIHPGQRPGGGLRHRCRERHQDQRARPRDAAARSPSRSAACWRRCAASPTSRYRRCSASRPSASTSTASGRPLRPVAGRHQRHHPGGGRRPGGGRPLRGRQRPPLPHDGAAGAAQYRENMEALKRIAIGAPGPTGRDPGAARRGRHDRPDEPAPSTSTASSRSATSRSSSRCAAATSAARCSRRSRRLREEVQLPAATGSTGRATSPTSRAPSTGCRSPCRSPSPLILLLLYVSFGTLRDTLLAGSAIPMALIGGILGLALCRHARSASRRRSASWRCSASPP